MGEVLFCGTSERGVLAWDLPTWTVIDRLTEHVGEVQALASLEGRFLVTGSSDSMLREFLPTSFVICPINLPTPRL